MKAVKVIGIILLVIILIIVGYGMTLSGEAHLERSIVINAPVEKVFKEVNTFKNIFSWSPWTKIDPDMKTEFSGPENGVGAKYDWTSEHPDVGIGSQEILESRQNEYVKTEMIFGIDGEFIAEFILVPIDGGTEVTWTYDGKVTSFMWKFIMPMMDGRIGPMYDQGVASLKTYIEGLPDPEPESLDLDTEAEVEIEEVED
jgi:hypothetical protein